MRWNSLLHRVHRDPAVRLVGHLAADPRTVHQDGTAYLVFRLAEAPDKEFWLRMYPTTPKRHRGDRVEIVFRPDGGPAIMIESALAAPEAEAARRRREEYLANVLPHDAPGPRGASGPREAHDLKER